MGAALAAILPSGGELAKHPLAAIQRWESLGPADIMCAWRLVAAPCEPR